MAGQIVMNIFMQFVYCFLFLIYLAFLPSGGGWAVSLIWAMMILPLADALQNCLQNLTSRIAGIDNEQMTGRVMGMGAMMGYGLGAIKEQFKSPSSNSSSNNGNNEGNGNGLKGFASRVKSVVNPTVNLSSEKDYDGNINPIRNVLPRQKETNQISIPKPNGDNKQSINGGNKITPKNVVSGVLKTGYSATKAYLKAGASLAEGNFDNHSYKVNRHNKNTFQNTEYINKVTNDNANLKKLGDENEPEG